jgi:hypothetical protein
MKYKETCECCNHTKQSFSHRLNKPILNGLKQLVNFYKEEKRGCNINQDITLTHNQKCNLPKLQHFGLIVRLNDGWYPTQRGYKFVHGMAQSPLRVITFDGIVPPTSHPAWKGVKVEYVDIWEVDEAAYLQREDYIHQDNLFSL